MSGAHPADDKTAAEAYETALAAHAEAPDVFETARTHLLYGAHLRRSGQRIKAREQLRTAHDAFAEMDLTAWALRAADELAATGAKPRTRRLQPIEPLTSQETRVALQAAQGLSNKEIAAALFLSPRTVEHHLSSVYRKRVSAPARSLPGRSSARGQLNGRGRSGRDRGRRLRATEDRGPDVRLRTRLTIDSSDIAPPFDFGFQLRHYVVHPKVRDGQQLVEIARLTSDKLVKIDIGSLGTVERPQLELSLSSAQPISPAEVAEARQLVVWRLGVADDLRPFYALVADDPVLAASIEHNFGAKGKATFSMFDAVIDVICAQNTNFRRLYEVRANLATAFGDTLVTNGRVYHASPTPAQLAAAPLEAIRACGVGYRDRYIKGVAEAVVRGFDVESLRERPRNEARDELLKLRAWDRTPPTSA